MNVLGPVPGQRHLRRTEVTHIALEGGGGKGIAYLGAVRALEEIGILPTAKHPQPPKKRQVKGFAGASAGAITAMLLASHCDFRWIRCWMAKTNFAKFFDAPDRRSVAWATSVKNKMVLDPGDSRTTTTEKALEALLHTWKVEIEAYAKVYEALTAANRYMPIVAKAAAVGAVLGVERETKVLVEMLQATDKAKEHGVADFLSGHMPAPFGQIGKHLHQYLAYLWRDKGLFSGVASLNEFDRILRELVRGSGTSGKDEGPVTFEEHFTRFRTELVVTGSNLNTGKTVFFSHRSTPQVPVCLAVRASMSLPFIYKPVYIVDPHNTDISGLYVDGGVWNNTPVTAFDSPGEPATLLDTISLQATFVLRLGIDYEDEFGRPDETSQNKFFVPKDLWDFFTRYAALTFLGGGESQFGPQRAFQAQELQITGLDLVNFTPPPVGRDRAIRRAYVDTMGYFEQPPMALTPDLDGFAGLPDDVKDNAPVNPKQDTFGKGCPDH